MKRITGSIQEKNGNWFAVINLYDNTGKRIVKWETLDLKAVKGSKKEAEYRLSQKLARYNTGDIYLWGNMTPAERERQRISEMLVADYLNEWLQGHKGEITPYTYDSYSMYIRTRIDPFFRKKGVTVKDVTGDEINEFYQTLRNSGLKGTSCDRYHAVLHIAFKAAVKRRIIPSNPVEQADRPKAEQYIGDFYNAEEVKHLLDCIKDDEIYFIVMLTVYYGLRRSEVLRLKWSAVDFTENKIVVRHKVLEGKDGPVGYDTMKTKSSYRSLPLFPEIAELLEKVKARGEEMKKVMRKGYCTSDSEYICVDALGRLYSPSFVSNHYAALLKKYGLRHIRFHDLRHSCASILLAKGVAMKMIQDWLGHSSMATTVDIINPHTNLNTSKRSDCKINYLRENDNDKNIIFHYEHLQVCITAENAVRTQLPLRKPQLRRCL